jgi:hypothetical protein
MITSSCCCWPCSWSISCHAACSSCFSSILQEAERGKRGQGTACSAALLIAALRSKLRVLAPDKDALITVLYDSGKHQVLMMQRS